MNHFLSRSRSFLLGASALGCLATSLRADVENYSFTPNAIIPDNNSSGLTDTHVISSTIALLTDVQLTLSISGGYNGDYYAYLSHAGGLTILLNRVGSTSGNSF